MRDLDILVCGCGPGGLATALLLHRDGHRVRLLDQFDAPRPVGSGLLLQPAGMAVLDHLGLADRMRALGQPVDRLLGRVVPSQRIVLDVSYAALGEPHQYGLAVHRFALFGTLYDAVVAAGIPIETRRHVSGIGHAASARPYVRLDDGETTEPVDLVVDALGARSPIALSMGPAAKRRPLAYGALWATLPWPAGASDLPFALRQLEQRYERSSVMIGVLPVGRAAPDGPPVVTFFWSLKPAHYGAWLKAGLVPWKDRIRGLWPETEVLLDQISDPAQLVLASYGHHTLQRPFGENIAIVGDAAHATSPQLGQGANMALIDAWALSRALGRQTTVAAALLAYAAARRRHVRLYQAMSALLTPFYQSDSAVLPVLRDQLMQPLTRLPGVPRLLAGLVAGTIGRPLDRLDPEPPTRQTA